MWRITKANRPYSMLPRVRNNTGQEANLLRRDQSRGSHPGPSRMAWMKNPNAQKREEPKRQVALNKKGNSRGSNITTATGMKDAQKMEESINPSAGKPWSFTREREDSIPPV